MLLIWDINAFNLAFLFQQLILVSPPVRVNVCLVEGVYIYTRGWDSLTSGPGGARAEVKVWCRF